MPWSGVACRISVNLKSPPEQWPGGTQTRHFPSAAAVAEAGRGSEGNESFTGAWGLLGRGPVPAAFGAGLEDEQEGTGPFAQWGVREGGYVAT